MGRLLLLLTKQAPKKALMLIEALPPSKGMLSSSGSEGNVIRASGPLQIQKAFQFSITILMPILMSLMLIFGILSNNFCMTYVLTAYVITQPQHLAEC